MLFRITSLFILLFSFNLVAQSPLDSMMQHAEYLGLKSADYTYQTGDSSSTKKAIQRFMMDLKFGRQPNLRFQGYDFKFGKDAFLEQISKIWQDQSIKQLAQHLITDNKELTQILEALKDSSKYTPAQRKILIKSANEYRWLAAARANRSLVLVNIPSSFLRAYESHKQVLQMKVVVGKPSRPSKTLSSQLKNMVLTPYWSVPRSISTEEMLPKIKKNVNYISASHLEVFDVNYQKLDPLSINWNGLSSSNFPYLLRQRSGKWNSLGLMKIQFDNPFRMYLHDTSEKYLFAREKRFFSHSCIRLENPIKLGSWLLKPNSAAIDKLDLKVAHYDKIPSYYLIKRDTPIVIWYSLVDFDENGKLKIYPDIYRVN